MGSRSRARGASVYRGLRNTRRDRAGARPSSGPAIRSMMSITTRKARPSNTSRRPQRSRFIVCRSGKGTQVVGSTRTSAGFSTPVVQICRGTNNCGGRGGRESYLCFAPREGGDVRKQSRSGSGRDYLAPQLPLLADRAIVACGGKAQPRLGRSVSRILSRATHDGAI